MVARHLNTDLIRALAISLVLVHHISQALPLSQFGHRLTSLGAYGVDLFFVLSGWLIGRLYWLELDRYDSVNIRRFWIRRWLRTIPPYLAVMPFAFLSVYLWRNEPFQWKYLLFLQNYETQIPFFSVSWSICVEEHFYLLMPLLILVIRYMRLPLQITLPMLIVVGMAARFLDPAAMPGKPFGYSSTASHLNFTGLAIGVWFAFLNVFNNSLWMKIQKISKWLFFPLLIGFFTIGYWSSDYSYYLGSSYACIVWSVVLAMFTAISPLRVAAWRATYYLALASFSIYLTHAMVLNACILITDKLQIAREKVFPLWLVLILLFGFATYAIVERTAIAYRDKIAPRQ